MSKYKYTSLLSSQYRQVFKSYHSLDRCEQELKDNLNRSLHKRIQTEVAQIEARNSLLHYQKPQFSVLAKKPETFLYYKTQSKYASSTNGFAHTMETDNYRTAYDRPEYLSKTGLNRYKNIQTDHQIGPFADRLIYPENQKTRANYHTLNNNYNNYELKTKASQINKRRNDIKLNARVKDIDKITKKYEYLTEPNQFEVLKTNSSNCKQSSIRSSQQNGSKQSQNIKFTSSRQLSNCSIQRNAKVSQEIVKIKNMQSSPLLQTNSNKLQMMKSKQNKQLSKAVFNKVNEQENIQTPHFHQTQIKKAPIEPSLISLKLQSLVKNTFTDRY